MFESFTANYKIMLHHDIYHTKAYKYPFFRHHGSTNTDLFCFAIRFLYGHKFSVSRGKVSPDPYSYKR